MPWSCTARYLTRMGRETAYVIAELMWLCDSAIRNGTLPTVLQKALHDLARTLQAE
jgi:hypothetical protein